MRRTRHQTSRGFTLIEILVALAIFALVITAIYSGWIAILRASKTGLEVAAQAQRERMAVHTLEQALTSARSFAADMQHYGFVLENGSEPRLSFVARLSKSFPRSGRFGDMDVRRVSFSVESGPDSERQLVLRQSPILMDHDEDEKKYPLVLARHVEEFLVKGWNPNGNEWVEEWLQTNQLPKMVQVTLRLGSPDQRHTSRRADAITRIVALPSVSVPAVWQTPPRPVGGQPGPPVQPGQPGAVRP